MLLKINNLAFKYDSHLLFNNLNMNIKQGEFVFLIGKSGSGKSTLLKIINQHLFPCGGSIEFDKFNSDTLKKRNIPALRQKLGVVFQDFKLLEERTVYENLAYILEVFNHPSKEIIKKVTIALNDIGLSHKRNSYPSELSGGEKQRVAIARAYINDPLLILADEPTGNLDPGTASEIIDIFNNVNKKGTAVLFATHNYELIKRTSNRILVLDNGEIGEVKKLAAQTT